MPDSSDPTWPNILTRSSQLSAEDILGVLGTARRIRDLAQTADGKAQLAGLARHRRVMLLFAQPSTRTVESFRAAAHLLGAQVGVQTGLASTSMAKGETPQDTARVLATFYDALVVRHPDTAWVDAIAKTSRANGVPVVSAGSGAHEHPTQALLDLLTLSDHRNGPLTDIRALVIGDIARNRAARSFCELMTRFHGCALRFVTPPAHRPSSVWMERLGVAAASFDSVDQALDDGFSPHVVYVTRNQQEWDPTPEGRGAASDMVLDIRHRERIPADCAVMHPLPRVNELPESWDDDPRCLIWRQVENGLWLRAAVLLHAWDLHL